MTCARAAQRADLIWERSPDETVAGYHVYCADVTLHQSSRIDVGNASACLITNLIEGRTYQFHVTAYDSAGLESDPSNVVEFSVPLGPLETIVTAGPGGMPAMRLRAPGIEGVRLALQSSSDLKNWTTIATVAEVGQSIDLTVVISGTVEKRFFRSVTVPQ